MKKFSKKLKKGFTLVELVVVIAIIAILSAASVATYFGVTTSARKTTGKAEAQQVMDVIRVAALDESDDSIKAVQGTDSKYSLKFKNAEAEGKGELSQLVSLLATNGIVVNGTNTSTIAQVSEANDTDGTKAQLKYSTAYYSYTIDFSNFTVGEAAALTE